ncbi:hypothetical protein D1007_40785 [Hordeum vulgare]|nr:hypothetical protein D1007_40785 [Hordeum vulgare]
MSTTPQAHGFLPHHPQASRLSVSTGCSSLEVSMVAPATPATMASAHVLRGKRKRQHELPVDTMEHARNLSNPIPTTNDKAKRLFMGSIIFEGGGGILFDPDETQSQDGRAPLMTGHEGMGNTFGEDNEGTVDPS